MLCWYYISCGDWTSLRKRRLLFAERSTCFWTKCEMCWSCCVEIRNEEGWSLHGLNETRRVGTHKHADYRHYELRICQWISARMCSLSQPDINCKPLQFIAPSNCFIMSEVISEVGWGSLTLIGLGFSWNCSYVRGKCLIDRGMIRWICIFKELQSKIHPFHFYNVHRNEQAAKLQGIVAPPAKTLKSKTLLAVVTTTVYEYIIIRHSMNHCHSCK